jgi:hypothetical protein
MTCVSARVTVAHVGPWTAELRMPDATELGARVTLRIGALTLVGAPVTDMQGVYGEQRWIRIAGGAAGWSRTIGQRGYHNDAGVKAQLVAEDAAREVGETLGSFVPVRERVGSDYARETGPASRALSRAIGNTAWWVDYAGVTQVGARPERTLPAASYNVVAFDPAARTATLIADDPTTIQVGATIVDGIDRPSVIRELEISATGAEPLRFHVWLGGADAQGGRLAALLESIVQRTMDAQLLGVYRYRVVRRGSDDRLDLQAVDADRGLPDLRAITVLPGVTAVRSLVTTGGIVLVAFAEGSRARPYVVSCAAYGGEGFAPAAGSSAQRAAREGDIVRVTLPTGTVSGTITIGTAANPFTGTITWAPSVYATGAIMQGSDIVFIAGAAKPDPAEFPT